jgi:hypothetical protein
LGHALARFQYARLSNHPHLLSLTGSLLSLRVAPRILHMAVKKYGESSGRFVTLAGHI